MSTCATRSVGVVTTSSNFIHLYIWLLLPANWWALWPQTAQRNSITTV